MSYFADRVKDTSTTTGTGDFTLSGSPSTGYVSFNSAFGTNVKFDYAISKDDESEWEVGYGYLSASTTLVRQTVTASSNANAAVNFSAGTKNVWCNWSAASAATVYDAVPTFAQGMWLQILFVQGINHFPWTGAAIAGGSVTSILGPTQAPGANRLSSATAASGYRIVTQGQLQGVAGLAQRMVILPWGDSPVTIRAGFHDTLDQNAPTDGAYFQVSGTTITGRVRNNTSESSTAGSYTITPGTWYVFDIDYTANDAVRFAVSDLVTGSLLFSETVSGSNVPNATTRTFVHGLVAHDSDASSAKAMCDLALFAFGPSRPSYCPVPA